MNSKIVIPLVEPAALFDEIEASFQWRGGDSGIDAEIFAKCIDWCRSQAIEPASIDDLTDTIRHFYDLNKDLLPIAERLERNVSSTRALRQISEDLIFVAHELEKFLLSGGQPWLGENTVTVKLDGKYRWNFTGAETQTPEKLANDVARFRAIIEDAKDLSAWYARAAELEAAVRPVSLLKFGHRR